jgi:hypothetical protein
MAAGRHVIAAATHRVDTAIHEAARDEPDWRGNYLSHFLELTRLSAQQHASLIAADGLRAVHTEFRFLRSGAELPLAEALAIPRANFLQSWSVTGNGALPAGLTVPYHGAKLCNDELRMRCDHWIARGIAEPSFAAAVCQVIDNPDWLDLRDTTMVVVGAGAEMGPVQSLLQWGAHVVAIDLPDRNNWSRLIELARHTPGTLTVPVRGGLTRNTVESQVVAAAGIDILTETPELLAWLRTFDQPFVIGDYAYAPGEAHVRTAVAVDAVVRQLLSERHDIGLAYLATPTDTYAVPSAVVEASQRRYSEAGALVTAVRGLSGGNLYRPNYSTIHTTSSGLRFGLADGLVPQQGANYALAKRIQSWRSHHARAHGVFASINVAPATRTRSVIRNRLLAAAYSGAHRFGLEVFEPAASSTLMAALLVHDLRDPRAVAHPGVPLSDPYELYVEEALHGGMWRAPYAPRSVMSMAVATGIFST